MSVQNQMLFLTVVIPIEFPPPVINWVPIMYDTVMVGADDDLITCIIVEALYEIIDMMRFRNMRAEFLTNQLSAELTAVAIKNSCHIYYVNLSFYAVDFILMYNTEAFSI